VQSRCRFQAYKKCQEHFVAVRGGGGGVETSSRSALLAVGDEMQYTDEGRRNFSKFFAII
jgi:hypothetical protein